MDLILEIADTYVFDRVYAKLLPVSMAEGVSSSWRITFELNSGMHNATMLLQALNSDAKNRECGEIYGYTPYLVGMTKATFQSLLPRYSWIREVFSVWAVVTVFGWLLYLSVASISYLFIFDRTIFNHPRYLKNQLALEIQLAMFAIPWMSLLTSFCFLIELKGYSNLYTTVDFENHGLRKIAVEIISFLLFTDAGIYLAHRWLHWPRVYKILHKPHHKWLVCTPFSSHTFHPVDGYIQSLPDHLYPFLMPLNKFLYLFLFTFVNFWTIMIHDGNHMSHNPYVNGTACHTVHHLYFNYNYGQFTTLWDRLGGSYRRPEDGLFNPNFNKDADVLAAQLKRVDAMKEKVEGFDDRIYKNDTISKKTQ